MKKLFLTLAATAMCATAFSSRVNLLNQDFESVTDVSQTGWTSGACALELKSADFGKYLEVYQGGGSGPRYSYYKWGNEIFMKDGQSVLGENGTYTIYYEFCITNPANQLYNSEFTVFTNHLETTNNSFRLNGGPWENFLFDMSQWAEWSDWPACGNKNAIAHPYNFSFNAPVIDRPYTETNQETGEEEEKVKTELDFSENYQLEQGVWYMIKLDVNVNERTVNWTVDSFSEENIASGTRVVPETDVNGDDISMYAEGIFVLCSRANCRYAFDNVQVYYESDEDFANDPSIALTSIGVTPDFDSEGKPIAGLNYRKYTVTFLEGETLHVVGTTGEELTAEWYDYNGNYEYYTDKSGVLKAWTSVGEAMSNVIEQEVECYPYPLPTASAKISSVSEGYGKTYTLEVSNADVALMPNLFLKYEFQGKNGTTLSDKNLVSGAKVTVPEEGELKVTTESFGYLATDVTIENNKKFGVKKVYDFARMTKDEYAARGFSGAWTFETAQSGSGFGNWNWRKHLWYYDLNQPTGEFDDNGNPTYEKVYPFYITDASQAPLGIESISVSADNNAAGEAHFEGLDVFAGHNICAINHIGVYNDETGGGNFKNIDVLNLDPVDFVMINRISGYGGNSNHPLCASLDEYYAQLAGEDEVYSALLDGKEVMNTEGEGESAVEVGTGKYIVSCPVYRIDTACSKLTVFTQTDGPVEGAVEGIEAEVAGDNYYYTIDGMRLAEPNGKGLYIHNGKKIIVK